MKIIYKKYINYYNKNIFKTCIEVEKRKVDDLEKIVDEVKNYNLHYVLNKKDISAIEEICVFIHIIIDDCLNTYKITKSYDINTKQIELYIPDDVDKILKEMRENEK